MAGTVADLLSGQAAPAPAAAPTAPAGPSVAPPPGFTADDSAPPPPPAGFQVQPQGQRGGGLVKDMLQGASEYWNDLKAPAVSAWQSLQKDAADSWRPRAPQNFAEKYIPGFSPGQQAQIATLGDIGALALSPITGVVNAEVVQPGAALLDQLPAPQRLSMGPNGKAQVTTLTPAEQHAQNEQIIGNALSALGPEGMEGGAAAKFATASGDAAIADVAKKYVSRVASVVSKVPAEVAIDSTGALTEEGREAAAKADVHPADVQKGYRAVQYASDVAPKAPAPEPAAAEPAPAAPPAPPPPPAANDATHTAIATANDASPAARPGISTPATANDAYPVVRVSPDQPAPANDELRDAWASLGREEPAAQAAEPAPPEPAAAPAPEPPAAPAPAPAAVWRGAEGDHPVEVTGAAHVGPDGRSYTPVRSQVHGGEGFVPTEDMASASAPTQAGPLPNANFGEDASTVPQNPRARAAQAESEGVNLTQGQATKDYSSQVAEENIRGADKPQTPAAQQFFAKQQQQIGDAISRFREAIGDPSATAEERGNAVRDAVSAMRDGSKAGIDALYTHARNLAKAIGGKAPDLIKLDTAPILAKLRGLMIDETVPSEVRNALRQQAAQYGLIGGEARALEDGTATVKMLDAEGKPARSIDLVKPPEPLTILNAEDMRQAVNSLYSADTSGKVNALKGVIDDAVQGAVERAAKEAPAAMGDAFKEARASYQTHQQTYSAKDAVQDILDWKVKGVTPKVKPEDVIRTILRGGADASTSLKKVKAVLLSKATEESRAAWQAIKSQAIGDIFNQATVTNAGGGVGGFSGAKLNTAIKKFGVDRLKILLSESEFNQLMKLQRITADATIQADRVANPSGSGHLIARFALKHGNSVVGKGLRSIPFIGHAVEAASDAAQIAKQHDEDQRTLRGITGYRSDSPAD